MILQILSDLHIEFHRDLGKSFIDALEADRADVLIVAGDVIPLHDPVVARNVFERLCRRYRDKPVLFVPGNHEFYGAGTIAAGMRTLDSFKDIDNLKVLDNDLVEIDGVEFVGSTLWFSYDQNRDRRDSSLLNDFNLISNFERDVNSKFLESVSYLNWHVNPNSIVITHHYPLPNSIHPQYARSPLNKFFGCDLSELIENNRPKLWVHGHTHNSFNYKYKDTHVVCNPFGYVAYDTNPEFILNMFIQT